MLVEYYKIIKCNPSVGVRPLGNILNQRGTLATRLTGGKSLVM